MMETLRATYIGDAITAGGFALVGVRSRITPAEAGAVWQAMREVRQNSDLVIINRAHADVIQARLQELIASEPIPPVVVVPTIDTDEPADDRVIEPARRVLGLS